MFSIALVIISIAVEILANATLNDLICRSNIIAGNSSSSQSNVLRTVSGTLSSITGNGYSTPSISTINGINVKYCNCAGDGLSLFIMEVAAVRSSMNLPLPNRLLYASNIDFGTSASHFIPNLEVFNVSHSLSKLVIWNTLVLF